jgi:hypothetical protein
LPGFQQVILPAKQQLGKNNCGLGIFLRTVKKAQNLDPLCLRPNPVNEDERRSVDDQLASAAPASDAADFGVIRQHIALLLDLPELVQGSAGTILRNVVYGMGAISPRPR